VTVTQRDEIVSRIRRRLQADGLDAYLAYTPQNNLYCSGYRSWFVGEHWRFHGGQLTLVPADPAMPLASLLPEVEVPPARQAMSIDDVRGYGMWIETRGLAAIAAPAANPGGPSRRPSWLDVAQQEAALRMMLGERNLLHGRIGTDLDSILLRSMRQLERVAPDVWWVDWTDAMFDLRAIKQPFEVDCLRRATELQEVGFEAVLDTLRDGMTAAEVRGTYTRAVVEAALESDRYPDFGAAWLLASVGADGAIGDGERAGRLKRGDMVKLDGGATVGGYKGDGGRTYAFGRPTYDARRLYDTLLAAHELACAELVPGRPVSNAFFAAERHIQANGYPQYCRGQYGHSVGLEQFPEEPPYISADEHRPVQAGMVFAVETPYYGSDLGSMTIEDLVLVTEHGPQPVNRLTRELVIVG
jgi:Xaa-Pro aminopeptidase